MRTLFILLFLSMLYLSWSCKSKSRNGNNQVQTKSTEPGYFNVNDACKKITQAIAGKIPYAGFLINCLLDAFWPNTKEDVWSSIEKQVTDLVDSKILSYELQEKKIELEAIKNALQMYKDAKIREKRGFLSTLLVKCDTLYERITQSSNDIHLTQVLLVLAYIELALLKERYEFGIEIYEEDNKQIWLHYLLSKQEKYESDLSKLYKKWQDWRSNKISAEAWVEKIPSAVHYESAVPPLFIYEANGEVKDLITGKTIKYKKTLTSPNIYKDIVNKTKQVMFNKLKAKFMETFQTSFALHQFKPGQEKVPPRATEEFGVIEFGPYRYNTVYEAETHKYSQFSTEDWDPEGKVTSVTVREWDIIDAVQFHYDGHDGTFRGNVRGGHAHNLIVPEGGHVTNATLQFAPMHNELVTLAFGFSDGSKTQVLGNRGRWRRLQSFTVGVGGSEDFRLASVSMPGTKYSRNIQQISFRFKHVSL